MSKNCGHFDKTAEYAAAEAAARLAKKDLWTASAVVSDGLLL